MDRPSKAMLARMPLAESVLLLWRWVSCDERMQDLWNQHRGRCYEKVISFSLVVHLIADALLKYNGSGRRAFEKAIENEELEASIQAAFKKLGRLPVPLSQAFLSGSTAALREAFPEWAEWQTPKSLRRFRVITLDGKAIKNVAKIAYVILVGGGVANNFLKAEGVEKWAGMWIPLEARGRSN